MVHEGCHQDRSGAEFCSTSLTFLDAPPFSLPFSAPSDYTNPLSTDRFVRQEKMRTRNLELQTPSLTDSQERPLCADSNVHALLLRSLFLELGSNKANEFSLVF